MDYAIFLYVPIMPLDLARLPRIPSVGALKGVHKVKFPYDLIVAESSRGAPRVPSRSGLRAEA
jgi:hypothetical protein